MIDRVAREWVGKPNLTRMVQILRDRDPRFTHLTHQRISDWRDKTQTDKIIWSEKTLREVEKGFLPGGDQTRYNVFVSFLSIVFRPITNDINRTNTLICSLISKLP